MTRATPAADPPGRADGIPAIPSSSTAAGFVQAWARGWWAVALHAIHTITASLAAVLVVLALAGVVTTPALGLGLGLIVLALLGARWLGRLERALLHGLLGVDVGDPPPSSAPVWRQRLALDLPRLQAGGWDAVHALWGGFAGAVVTWALSRALMLVALPLYAGALPDSGLHLTGWLTLDSTLGYAVGWVVGLVTLVVLPWVATSMAGVDVALARRLLGVDPEHQLREMSHRMETLTTTRTEAIDSVEAERRRIERDLHDGPQQRLVSIAMTLGLARDALDHGADPKMVRELLDEAHSSSKDAITEMRQVARGIVPPILTDRGLDAAVSALAARSPVPVTVTSKLPGRLEPTIEAIAYFSISEALTNVAKHAGASRAKVDLGTGTGRTGPLLAVTISDDGRGGAVMGGGTGLTGLRQRVAAVDGELHVHSPHGGGTTVSLSLPLRHLTQPTTQPSEVSR